MRLTPQDYLQNAVTLLPVLAGDKDSPMRRIVHALTDSDAPTRTVTRLAKDAGSTPKTVLKYLGILRSQGVKFLETESGSAPRLPQLKDIQSSYSQSVIGVTNVACNHLSAHCQNAHALTLALRSPKGSSLRKIASVLLTEPPSKLYRLVGLTGLSRSTFFRGLAKLKSLGFRFLLAPYRGAPVAFALKPGTPADTAKSYPTVRALKLALSHIGVTPDTETLTKLHTEYRHKKDYEPVSATDLATKIKRDHYAKTTEEPTVETAGKRPLNPEKFLPKNFVEHFESPSEWPAGELRPEQQIMDLADRPEQIEQDILTAGHSVLGQHAEFIASRILVWCLRNKCARPVSREKFVKEMIAQDIRHGLYAKLVSVQTEDREQAITTEKSAPGHKANTSKTRNSRAHTREEIAAVFKSKGIDNPEYTETILKASANAAKKGKPIRNLNKYIATFLRNGNENPGKQTQIPTAQTVINVNAPNTYITTNPHYETESSKHSTNAIPTEKQTENGTQNTDQQSIPSVNNTPVNTEYIAQDPAQVASQLINMINRNTDTIQNALDAVHQNAIISREIVNVMSGLFPSLTDTAKTVASGQSPTPGAVSKESRTPQGWTIHRRDP
ncbi:hypothetical protein [Fulvitalea axinellae]